MKSHLYHKYFLCNQEIFETGKCSTYNDIPQLKNLILLTKNKQTNNEEILMLKIILFQLVFCKKAFILIELKNDLTFKKLPIGGFVTLRKNLGFFLDFFFHTTLKKRFELFFVKTKPFFVKFLFTKQSYLIKHNFRYLFILNV